MTLKRKDDGDLEIVKLGGMNFSYRAILIVLVASATPFADPVLHQFGLKLPPATAPTVPSAKLLEVDQKIDELHVDMAKIDEKVSKVAYRIDMFQVDFDKYRANRP